MVDTSALEDEVNRKLTMSEQDEEGCVMNTDQLSDLSSSDDDANEYVAIDGNMNRNSHETAREELPDEEVLDKAAEYFWSETFSTQFEEFMVKNCAIFTDDDESKLEYTKIFEQYQELFESCMTGYLDSIHVTGERFYSICQKVMKSEDEEDEQIKSLVNIMLSVADYEVFLQEMKRMAREQRGDSDEE